MNTKSLFIAFALALVVGATGLVAYQGRNRQNTQDVRDAGLLGQGGALGTGLGADRNANYQRRVRYYKNPNAPKAVSNVATGALDTAGAVLPWNWGRNRDNSERRHMRSSDQDMSRENRRMRNNQ